MVFKAGIPQKLGQQHSLFDQKDYGRRCEAYPSKGGRFMASLSGHVAFFKEQMRKERQNDLVILT